MALIPAATCAAINAQYIIFLLLLKDLSIAANGTPEQFTEKVKRVEEYRIKNAKRIEEEHLAKIFKTNATGLDTTGLSLGDKKELIDQFEDKYYKLNKFIDNTDYITYNNRFRKRPKPPKDDNNNTNDKGENNGYIKPNDNMDNPPTGTIPNNNGNVPNNDNTNNPGSSSANGSGIPGISIAPIVIPRFMDIMEKIIDASLQAATPVPCMNFLLPMVAGTFKLMDTSPAGIAGSVATYFTPIMAPGPIAATPGCQPTIVINTAPTIIPSCTAELMAGSFAAGFVPYLKLCEGIFNAAKLIQFMVTEVNLATGVPVVVPSMLT